MVDLDVVDLTWFELLPPSQPFFDSETKKINDMNKKIMKRDPMKRDKLR